MSIRRSRDIAEDDIRFYVRKSTQVRKFILTAYVYHRFLIRECGLRLYYVAVHRFARNQFPLILASQEACLEFELDLAEDFLRFRFLTIS